MRVLSAGTAWPPGKLRYTNFRCSDHSSTGSCTTVCPRADSAASSRALCDADAFNEADPHG
jgi:hypothetical protein